MLLMHTVSSLGKIFSTERKLKHKYYRDTEKMDERPEKLFFITDGFLLIILSNGLLQGRRCRNSDSKHQNGGFVLFSLFFFLILKYIKWKALS